MTCACKVKTRLFRVESGLLRLATWISNTPVKTRLFRVER